MSVSANVQEHCVECECECVGVSESGTKVLLWCLTVFFILSVTACVSVTTVVLGVVSTVEVYSSVVVPVKVS